MRFILTCCLVVFALASVGVERVSRGGDTPDAQEPQRNDRGFASRHAYISEVTNTPGGTVTGSVETCTCTTNDWARQEQLPITVSALSGLVPWPSGTKLARSHVFKKVDTLHIQMEAVPWIDYLPNDRNLWLTFNSAGDWNHCLIRLDKINEEVFPVSPFIDWLHDVASQVVNYYQVPIDTLWGNGWTWEDMELYAKPLGRPTITEICDWQGKSTNQQARAFELHWPDKERDPSYRVSFHFGIVTNVPPKPDKWVGLVSYHFSWRS